MSFVLGRDALTAQQNISKYRKVSSQSLSRLSSGDKRSVAGLEASESLIGDRVGSTIANQKQSAANISKARTFLEIVESSYSSINDVLRKQSILAVKGSNATLSDTQRSIIDSEFKDLSTAINQIIDTTKFNQTQLFSEKIAVKNTKGPQGVEVISASELGTFKVKYNRKPEKFVVQEDGVKIGAFDITKSKGQGIIDFSIKGLDFRVDESKFNFEKSFGYNAFTVESVKDKTNEFSFSIAQGRSNRSRINAVVEKTDVEYLGLDSADLTTQAGSQLAIDVVNTAKEKLAESRAKVSSVISRLDFASSYASVALENTQAAQQGLVGVDLSQEVVKFITNQNILNSGVFLLAQANQRNSDILSLVKN